MLAQLAQLASVAIKLGYSEIWLETRVVNLRALAFCGGNGYSRIPNCGHHIGRAEAVCLATRLPAACTTPATDSTKP